MNQISTLGNGTRGLLACLAVGRASALAFQARHTAAHKRISLTDALSRGLPLGGMKRSRLRSGAGDGACSLRPAFVIHCGNSL
jgi:hypothetical protein